MSGIEPLASAVQGRRSPCWATSPNQQIALAIRYFNIYSYYFYEFTTTHAMTYFFMVGLPGVEPGTSRLSGVRSNQLS